MSPYNYTVALSSALRANQLNHTLYDVLVAVAQLQAADGFATYPRLSMALGCTYNNLCIHTSRNPDFFQIETGQPLRRLTLTPAAIELLAKVKVLVDRRMKSAESHAPAAP
jgi:hypothetical protein